MGWPKGKPRKVQVVENKKDQFANERLEKRVELLTKNPHTLD